MGITDLRRVYTAADLAPGRHLIFAATGVTEGALMKGVRFFRDGTRTASLVMQTSPRQIRFIDSIHASQADNVTIRF
jgi:fructose-1,6-bisphosphatase/sedoheptulose 1,7-bisphosphatase-like protein